MSRNRAPLPLIALASLLIASTAAAFPVADQPDADNAAGSVTGTPASAGDKKDPAVGVPAPGNDKGTGPAAPKKPRTPPTAAELGGYATPDQVVDLSDDDLKDFIAITKDKTWPSRHVDYLRDAKGMEPAVFAAQAKPEQGQVYLEWLRQRLKARMVLEGLSMQPTLGDPQVALLQSYAKAGFYSPSMTKRLLGSASPVVANLTAIDNAVKGGGSGKVFDNSSNEKELVSAEQRVGDNLDLFRFQNPNAKPNPLEQDYRVAHDMAMNPEGFRKSRPDWFKDATPDEIKAQNNLASQIGHVYQTMDYLRRQGKLEIIVGPDNMGRAMADTSLHVERGKNGEADWKIVVRVGPTYMNADPVLLAPILTHEFEHAYDFYQHVSDQKNGGVEVAQIISDFQEEEMRAFITQSNVDVAYARQIRAAAMKQPGDQGARTLYSSSLTTQELSVDKDKDPAAYKASLAKLAQNALRERGYANTSQGINSLKTMSAQWQDERRNLEAELTARQSGDAGLDAAIAKATKDGDYDLRAALVIQKTRPARNLTEIQDDITRVDKIINTLGGEQKRGLAIKVNSGLKTDSVPAPRQP